MFIPTFTVVERAVTQSNTCGMDSTNGGPAGRTPGPTPIPPDDRRPDGLSPG
jgi:hypothetical protein